MASHVTLPNGMEESGLLVSRQELVEGRNRRVYAATEAGRAELDHLRGAIAELAEEVLVEPGRPIRGSRAPSSSTGGQTTS